MLCNILAVKYGIKLCVLEVQNFENNTLGYVLYRCRCTFIFLYIFIIRRVKTIKKYLC